MFVVDNKNKKEEIENFIEKYSHSTYYRDVPVASMRHIIPLLLVDIYPQEYGHFSRKGEIYKTSHEQPGSLNIDDDYDEVNVIDEG